MSLSTDDRAWRLYTDMTATQPGASNTIERERVLVQVRRRCREALDRLFPGGDDNTALGDWNQDDIHELTAVFELARIDRLAESDEPMLTRHTVIRVIKKLATGGLFDAQFSPSILREKEQHLRLLASALRLFKYEELSLSSEIRNNLYDGLT